jgi:hypothetical protein
MMTARRFDSTDLCFMIGLLVFAIGLFCYGMGIIFLGL